MKVKIMLHNFSHALIPILLAGLISLIDKTIDPILVFLVALLGSFFPDLDHFQMWRKVYFKSFREFLVFCLTNRYRRAFLFFHNYLTIIIASVLLPIMSMLNLYYGIFILAFIFHLFWDFVADSFALKVHSHWKIRSRI